MHSWPSSSSPSALARFTGARPARSSYTLRDGSYLVLWSRTPSDLLTLAVEPLISISSAHVMREIAARGRLLVPLANGWGWSGEDGGRVYETFVTLNFQVKEKTGGPKAPLILRVL